MGSVLDSIVKHVILEGPQTISANFKTDIIDISNIDTDYAIQMVWNNGVNVAIDGSIEVSVDGINFVEIPETIFNFNTPVDTAIWEINARGVTFMRVSLKVTTGSFDVQSIYLTGNRRH